MLNTTKECGKPIAYIRGGILDGEILHIANDDEVKKYKDDEQSYENESEASDDSEYSDSEESSEESESSEEDKEPTNKNDIGFTKYLSLEKYGGIFEPIPDQSTREINYIAGKSGSGKSSYAGMLINKYLTLNPGKPIYVFSMKDKDPALDKFKIYRIPINNDLVDNPIDLQKEIPTKTGAVILFDDVNPDTIRDTKLKKELDMLKINILEYGRSNNIDLIYTSHLINPTQHNFGRIIMNELHNLITFKNGCSHHQRTYALTNHLGYSKKDSEKISNINSRWTLVSNTYPEYILTEKKCIISGAVKDLKL